MKKNEQSQPMPERLVDPVLRIRIPSPGFDRIEKSGQIELNDQLRTEVEDVLNSYIRRSGWDRTSRPSKEKKAQLKSLTRNVAALMRARDTHLQAVEHVLQSLNDLNRKFSGAVEYHPGIALEMQCLFHRAGVHPHSFIENLVAINKVLKEGQIQQRQNGRPSDLFLSQFFCELEDIYRRAGGRQLGVTNRVVDGMRESRFADFVNAILRCAPAGIGPSSHQAVASAWQRQSRKMAVTRRA